MSTITCGNCHETHESVAAVRACYESAGGITTSSAEPATARQLSLITTLREEREMTEVQRAVHVSTLSKVGASRYIDELIGQPYVPKESRRSVEIGEITEGMYKVGDAIYKVQRAVNGSGHLYAKRLHGGTFVYEVGAMARLRPEFKMTLEDAKKWGALYGTCCVCGRVLTDERSIAAGIGPVCAGKGWW